MTSKVSKDKLRLAGKRKGSEPLMTTGEDKYSQILLDSVILTQLFCKIVVSNLQTD